MANSSTEGKNVPSGWDSVSGGGEVASTPVLYVEHSAGGPPYLYSYRCCGVMIERFPVMDSHPQEHLIPVIKRLRVFRGGDIGYRLARRIWDARVNVQEVQGNA